MGKLQKVITTTFVAFALMLGGCGSDNSVSNSGGGTPASSSSSASVENNSTIAFLSLDASVQNLVVTENSETRSIIIKAFDAANAPVTSGKIKIGYPSESVTSNVDVGSMNPLIDVNISDGKAIFTYTAPNDLKALVANGIAGATFTFFDPSNPERSVQLPITYNPSPDAIDNARYEAEIINATGNDSLSLESKVPFTITMKEIEGDVLKASDIVTVKVTTLNTNIATIINDNVEVNSVTYSQTNPKTLTLQTNTVSGLVTLKLEYTIIDKNGNNRDLVETVGLTVLSGPPTAASFNQLDVVGRDAEKARYKQKFVIHLTDKYNNPINTLAKINVGVMSGYAKVNDANGSGFLYSSPQTEYEVANGVLSSNGDVSRFDISGGYDLTGIDPFNDYLVTAGPGYRYQASGKWEIASVGTNSLELKDSFNSQTAVSGLSFAVGHNYRQVRCSSVFGNPFNEAIATVDSSDGKYIVDKDGNAHVTIDYDYYLAGKDVVLYVNFIGTLNSEGKELRFGEMNKFSLRAQHMVAVPETYSIPKGSSGLYHFAIWMERLGDNDFNANEDNTAFYQTERLRNSNFGWAVDVTGDGVSCQFVERLDPQTCENDGLAYLVYSCTAAGDGGGTISITKVGVAKEFD